MKNPHPPRESLSELRMKLATATEEETAGLVKRLRRASLMKMAEEIDQRLLDAMIEAEKTNSTLLVPVPELGRTIQVNPQDLQEMKDNQKPQMLNS